MTNLTQEEKIKIFEKLPKELQNLMQSEDTGAFLLYLGDKYNLDDDKISLLSRLVGDIVLGITPITSLAQEINSKIISDSQASMHMAQELYAELLAPVMAEAKPTAPSAPTAPVTTPAPPSPSQISPRETLEGKPPRAVVELSKPQVDKYREPVSGLPEVVDLRKTPPSPADSAFVAPTSAKEAAGYGGQRPPVAREGGLPPGLPISVAPIPPVIKKIEPPALPIPLIEANPHLPAKISPEISAGKITPPPTPPQPSQISPRETLEDKPPVVSRVEPQFIIRPPGIAPTDAPRNILDLRRDKGEF